MVDDGGLDIAADDGGQLTRAIRALVGSPAVIQDRTNQAIHDLGDSLALDASLAVLAEPTHGTKHTGLRLKVSQGVNVSDIDSGVSINTAMPEDDELIIPRGFDTAVGGRWRHPLFGHDPWYYNYGGFSWFMGTMQEGLEQGNARLIEMLDEVAESVARAS